MPRVADPGESAARLCQDAISSPWHAGKNIRQWCSTADEIITTVVRRADHQARTLEMGTCVPENRGSKGGTVRPNRHPWMSPGYRVGRRGKPRTEIAGDLRPQLPRISQPEFHLRPCIRRRVPDDGLESCRPYRRERTSGEHTI